MNKCPLIFYFTSFTPHETHGRTSLTTAHLYIHVYILLVLYIIYNIIH